MAGPIDKTMQVLGSTANSHALEVLIAALDVQHDEIQRSALNTLIKRKSSRGHLEIVRRLPGLVAEARESLESQISRIDSSLKQALLHGDPELRAHALELVRATEGFDQIPVLLEMLKDDRAEITDNAAETMRDLTDRLYEHSRGGKGSRRPDRYLRNVSQVKHNVLAGFDRALSHFDELSHTRDVVEAVLILGDADNFAVQKSLVKGSADCRRLTGELLLQSKHQGVMELVLEFMSKNYPPPKVFEVMTQRGDAEFVAHLLRWLPNRLTAQQQKNFQQIESVAWIDADRLALEAIAPSLQPGLVNFVTVSGLPFDVKMKVHEWVVRHGTPDGRLAASNVLDSMDQSMAQEIVTGGLESEDEEIQAWATHQLRSQHVPEAIALLVERLDSPLPAVRAAARDELQGFDISIILDNFERISPAVCLRAGELIRKIDLDCVDKLRKELKSPISRRRIRAARAAVALGMQDELVPTLVAMLSDDDPLVRRTSIGALATVRTAETIEALSGMLNDENERVRDEVIRVLSAWNSLATSAQ